ncbi:MAG: FAD-dependent oxidoreductase, partial [Spirochaetales bacterium]
TPATPESVAGENPYAVILATGGHSIIPSSIEGSDKKHVMTSEQLLDAPEVLSSGDRVVVVGAGLTGCESADMLARRGLDVTLLEMVANIAPEAHVIDQIAMGQSLSQSGVKVKTGTRLTGIYDSSVEVEATDSGSREQIECDWVVLALGLDRPSDVQIRSWKDSFDRVIVIGDSLKPRRVAEAANEGFHAAFVMQ